MRLSQKCEAGFPDPRLSQYEPLSIQPYRIHTAARQHSAKARSSSPAPQDICAIDGSNGVERGTSSTLILDYIDFKSRVLHITTRLGNMGDHYYTRAVIFYPIFCILDD